VSEGREGFVRRWERGEVGSQSVRLKMLCDDGCDQAIRAWECEIGFRARFLILNTTAL
jgi:hypothetical protein